ncbi:MAG: TIGR04372 family glycosyltransferase [Ilumatobacteraceae bacterium]
MISKKIAKGILWIPSVLVLLVLRILHPLVRIQLLVVAFHRFGHLALEPEVFLSLDDIKIAKKHDGYRFPKQIQLWSLGPRKSQANRFLAKKWKDVLLSPPSWCIDSLLNVGEKLPVLRLDTPKLSVHGPTNALDHSGPHLSFSLDELKRGRTELEKLGVDSDRPIACLIVRDGGYYAARGEVENQGYEFLNFDISTFEFAAKSLVSRGYQVIRMGAGSENPFGIEIEGVFDYALSPHRSEFLDIYIAAHCRFAVSTQTGPDAVCLAFRRPVCYIDVTRFSQFFFGTKLAYWNPSELQRDGKRLTLKEIVSSDIMWIKDPNEFIEHGIRSVRSTPQGIERLVSGFVDLCESDFKMSQSDHDLSRRAQEIIETGMGERGVRTFGRITAQLNPAFLHEQGDWFLAF